MIGETISHYRILEKLGEGGMGIVYKAEDIKLRRTVALKFLPPELMRDAEAKKRFIREAQAAAALDHPNICTVYEVGEAEDKTFISMAYIEGESLKQRLESGSLELGDALGIAAQAAEGLKAAHAKGVIHRDMKSANVMITPEGKAKIMDFGLAKTAEATRVTRTGTTLGTVAYMSPEQALGQEIDQRTDIWSLGVMLYELLTGRLPFKGDLDPAIMYAIINENHDSVTSIKPSVPLEVERVVDQTLAKDPTKRYQSAGELSEALDELREGLDLLPKRSHLQVKLIRQRKRIAWTAVAAIAVIVLAFFGIRYFTGATRAIDSIAVLPFEDITSDTTLAHLTVGMTNDLTGTLGQVSGLKKVVSSRTMKQYEKTDKTPQEVAAEREVKAVAAPTVLYSGERAEISIELIRGVTGELLWSERFECSKSEYRSTINRIVQSITEEVGINLTPEEEVRLVSISSIDPKAYDLYLRGRYMYEHGSWDDTEKTYKLILEYYNEAIAIDSMCAPAYAAMAEVIFQHTHVRWFVPEDPMLASKAKAAALKAVEIDETLAEGHAALGHVLFEHDYDFPAAEREYKRAFELNPSYTSNAFAYCIYAYLLESMGRFDEAADAISRAMELDPTARFIAQVSPEPLILAGRYEQALESVQRTADMFSDWRSENYYLAWLSACQGDYVGAAQHLEEIDISERSIDNQYMIAESYRRAGRINDANRSIDIILSQGLETEESSHPIAFAIAHAFKGERDEAYARLEEAIQDTTLSPLLVARTYMELGDVDKTFIWLEKAYDARIIWLVRLRIVVETGMWKGWLGTKRIWEPIRNDPRYLDLIKRMGLMS
jgi:TolB-like protein/predicted Ser/Thr protein kinase